jgi:uncharacterized YccA/Bax inhibitor family protein
LTQNVRKDSLAQFKYVPNLNYSKIKLKIMISFSKSSNPAFSDKFLKNTSSISQSAGTMTIQGTVNKTAIMLLLVVLSATYTWKIYFEATEPSAAMPWMIGGMIGGLIAAIITIFKKEWSAYTAPLYAILEGLFLGGISAFFEAMYPGLVMQAVGLTFSVFFALLFFYKTGIIKATNKFKMGVVAATGGIGVIYLLSWILGMFGIFMPMIHGNGIFGIGFSIFVVIIAALNLVLDFDFIEKGSQSGLPKYMEWYGAFGLMVTLVWLYIEILRLLSKLASRD